MNEKNKVQGESKEKTNVYWNNAGISLRGYVQVRFSQEEACQGDTDVRLNTWVCGRITATVTSAASGITQKPLQLSGS